MRCSGRVRGGQQVRQRELKHVVVPGQVAFGHDRRQRVGHGPQDARDRLAGRDVSVTVSRGCRTACATSPTAEVARRLAKPNSCDQSWPRASRTRSTMAQPLTGRGVRHRSEVFGVGFDVEQHAGDVHAAHAIGQRVMEFHDERGLAVLEPLDERVLPQRPIPVQARHPGLTRELEHRSQGLRRCRLEPADVPRQVEVGIDHPAGRGQPQRRQHHPVPEPRRQPGGALQPFRQPIPVRRTVQNQHTDHRRAQQRVLLHVPGERVTVAHVNVQPFTQSSHPLPRGHQYVRTPSIAASNTRAVPPPPARSPPSLHGQHTTTRPDAPEPTAVSQARLRSRDPRQRNPFELSGWPRHVGAQPEPEGGSVLGVLPLNSPAMDGASCAGCALVGVSCTACAFGFERGRWVESAGRVDARAGCTAPRCRPRAPC